MLFQSEIDLIKAMHEARALAETDKTPRPSTDYVLIFSGWLMYTSGYSILWVYDADRFADIAGACAVADLDQEPILYRSSFVLNEAYEDLTDPDRMALINANLPVQVVDAEEVDPLTAYAEASTMVDNEERWLDASWCYLLLMKFCSMEETVSVHTGPAPRYLDTWRGVWFKKGANQFLGMLPVVKKAK